MVMAKSYADVCNEFRECQERLHKAKSDYHQRISERLHDVSRIRERWPGIEHSLGVDDYGRPTVLFCEGNGNYIPITLKWAEDIRDNAAHEQKFWVMLKTNDVIVIDGHTRDFVDLKRDAFGREYVAETAQKLLPFVVWLVMETDAISALSMIRREESARILNF